MGVLTPKKTPFKDQKPCILPLAKRGKAVTIAVAVQCPKGVVLGADSLMSHGTAADIGSFAHYETKVHSTNGNYFAAALTGAASDAEQLRSFAGYFLPALRAAETEDAESIPNVKQILESELNNFATLVNAAPEISLLVAGITSPFYQPELFRTTGLVVRSAGPVEVVGIGETSLIQYAIDSIYQPDMSLRQAQVLTAFLVYAGKRFCPQYCGGKTDIHFLKREYPLWDCLTEWEITTLEKFFRNNEKRTLRQFVDQAIDLLK